MAMMRIFLLLATALISCNAFHFSQFPLSRRSKIYLSSNEISATSSKELLTSTPYSSISRSELNECILKVSLINDKAKNYIFAASLNSFIIFSWRKVSQSKIQLNPPCSMAFGRLLTLEELLLLECWAIR